MCRRRLLAVALLLSMLLSACTSGAQNTRLSPDSPETEIRVSGSGTALPLVRKLAASYSREHPSTRFRFESGTNSGGAIQGVLKGTLDLAVANRPLSEAEAREALEYHPFARDAVAFAVHAPSSVRALSTAQVRAIFGGDITDWQELGWPGGPIMLLDRDEDESMRKLVLLPLLDGRHVDARTIVLTSAKDMLEALEATPNSLGYTSLGLLRIQRPRNVTVLTLDGVAPGSESVIQGRYPWYMTFGLIHHRDAPPSPRRFVDFVLGAGGRTVLEEYGYAGVER